MLYVISIHDRTHFGQSLCVYFLIKRARHFSLLYGSRPNYFFVKCNIDNIDSSCLYRWILNVRPVLISYRQLSGTYRHSKLARLVKGCLLCLDHLESGTQKYVDYKLDSIDYSVDNLVDSLDQEATTYLFSTNEESALVNAILNGMCYEYPNPVFGGVDHVSIPADSKDVVLVGTMCTGVGSQCTFLVN